MVPHGWCTERAHASEDYIKEPLSGPCLTCGYEGHVYRVLYNPEASLSRSLSREGVANKATCSACGAGDGNLEPVHDTHTITKVLP